MRDVFRTAGLSDADATTAADVAVYGSMHGTDAHGAVQLPLYITGVLARRHDQEPARLQNLEKPALLRGNRCRSRAGAGGELPAMNMAIERAKTYGLGAVAVRNSSHFAGAGYYCDLAARQNLVGLRLPMPLRRSHRPDRKSVARHQSNRRLVSPRRERSDHCRLCHGGGGAFTRPRDAGFGTKHDPGGLGARCRGQPHDGCRPSCQGLDPPDRGPKGYALALMVELLCTALSDCEPGFQITYENVVKRPSTIGQFFLALNPAGFVRSGYEEAHQSCCRRDRGGDAD